jgi:chorismate dehydratase
LKKIKVGIVNYLNTAPLVYGLRNSKIIDEIELIPDYPANLAKDLLDGSIDVGLVPVAVITQLPEWWLIGNHCIGCDGPVASVCIFSDVPIGQTKTILLDYQSRTSVELAKLLINKYWKLNVTIESPSHDFMQRIQGNTAGLVIGDRSFDQRNQSKFAYDLGEAWKDFTGLPFVFAAWISNKPLNADFITRFNEANAFGVQHIPDVIKSLKFNGPVDLEEYFKKYINYDLDDKKREALKMFLHFLNKEISV